MDSKPPIVVPQDGTITPALRQRLREKRTELGVALKQLAGVLNLDWGTISKWENGKVKRCSISNRCRLERFLNGAYDSQFRDETGFTVIDAKGPSRPGIETTAEMPPTIQRLAMIHTLCNDRPDLQRELQRNLEMLIDAFLAKLAKPPKPPKG